MTRILPAALVLIALIGMMALPLVRAQGNCEVVPSNATLDGEEREFLDILNTYRAQNGVGPLVPSDALNRAAAWMVHDLATHTYFAHTSSDGRSPSQRAAACGYPYGVGENLAGGFGSAQAVFEGWRASPGHNANMLGSGYRVIGIGREVGGPYGVYWATSFGYVLDAPATATATQALTVTPWPYRQVVPGVAKDGMP